MSGWDSQADCVWLSGSASAPGAVRHTLARGQQHSTQSELLKISRGFARRAPRPRCRADRQEEKRTRAALQPQRRPPCSRGTGAAREFSTERQTERVAGADSLSRYKKFDDIMRVIGTARNAADAPLGASRECTGPGSLPGSGCVAKKMISQTRVGYFPLLFFSLPPCGVCLLCGCRWFILSKPLSQTNKKKVTK